MSALAHRVGANIVRHRLWAAGDRVIVAVSGGMDSVVLLDVLIRTAAWHKGRLEVATIDHGTRPDSAADAAFVRDLAAAHALVCHAVALNLGPASEEACRRGRYEALDALGAIVALAHHERDQAETIVVQLLRGSGLAGLAGMGWVNGRRVRPLLDVPYADLRAYAENNALGWVEDASNADPAFVRNRVRAEVLPLLDAIRPGAVGALARSATRIAADQAFLDDQLAAWTPATVLTDAPEPVARLAVRRANPGVSAGEVDAILAAARGSRR